MKQKPANTNAAIKQIGISDFRAHIGQHLDELTAKNERGGHLQHYGTPGCWLQVGDIRNDSRVLMCTQDVFRDTAIHYATLQRQYFSLRAMNLTSIGTLLHAPALDNIPLNILTSICTLFEATHDILRILLQQCPYRIFDDLDMRPIFNQQSLVDAPLSLYTFARFILNTFNPIVVGDEPLHIDTIIDNLQGEGTLNLTFNADITKCDDASQTILREAIRAVHSLLQHATAYDNVPCFASDLELWYAKYVNDNIPMHYDDHIWTYDFWKSYQPMRTVIPSNPSKQKGHVFRSE